MQAEGPKVMGTRCWFSALSCVYKDFSGFSESLLILLTYIIWETSFKAICSCSLLQIESEIRKTSPPLHLQHLLWCLNYLIIIGFCFCYILSNKTKTLFFKWERSVLPFFFLWLILLVFCSYVCSVSSYWFQKLVCNIHFVCLLWRGSTVWMVRSLE